ncbi:MAG: arylsulfatase, partial [Victivallaceae bacterium]
MNNDERPNVILIVTDEMRADSIGANNSNGAFTPHMDTMIRNGVNFTKAYSACPSCIAARASLLTGQDQYETGFTGYQDKVLWQYTQTLPQLMAENGYHTQCVGKMHVYPPRNLLGFHNVVLHDGYLHAVRGNGGDYERYDDYLPWLRSKMGADADIIDDSLGCNGYAVRVWPWDERFHPSTFVSTQSIDFLRRRDTTKPFFLKISYHRPHPPLDPVRSFMEMYDGVDLPEPPLGDWRNKFTDSVGWGDSPVPSDKYSRDRARKGYYALITQIDYEINRLYMALGEYNLLHNTIIIFTSDHGDLLYDHKLCRKILPFEGSVHIPLFIYPHSASRWVSRRGSSVDTVCELRDILPTIMAECGIKIKEPVSGIDLYDLPAGRILQGEHAAGDNSNFWITDGKEKFIWFCKSGLEMLFNLVDD